MNEFLGWTIILLLAVFLFASFHVRPQRKVWCEPDVIDDEHTVVSLRKRGGA